MKRILSVTCVVLVMAACAWAAFGTLISTHGTGAFIQALSKALPGTLPWLALAWWMYRSHPGDAATLIGALGWGFAVTSALMSHVNLTMSVLVSYLAMRGGVSDDLSSASAFGGFASSLVSAPLGEELLKGLPLILIMLFRPRRLLCPLDGVLIATLSAMGFACAENVFYLLQQPPSDDGTSLAVSRAVRHVPLHICCSMVFGLCAGIAAMRPRVAPRAGWLLAGWLIASAIHAWWNLSVLMAGWRPWPGIWFAMTLLLGVIIIWHETRQVAAAVTGIKSAAAFRLFSPGTRRLGFWRRWMRTTTPTEEELAHESALLAESAPGGK